MTLAPTWKQPVWVAGPLAAAAVAWGLNLLVPLISPLLIALVLGVVVANTSFITPAWLSGQVGVAKHFLRWGVVLLGLRLSIDSILGIGAEGIVVVVATVVATYVGTIALGARLALPSGLVTLVATGFSICGAAAIAAVEDTVKSRKGDVALAIALVTVFGSMMILLVPALAALLDLNDEQAAVWAGASIHEVAQVVAAASMIGTGAVAVATTVKLGRVLLLAPVYALTARREGTHGSAGTALVPWFVAGFMASVVVRSADLLPRWAFDVGDLLAIAFLAAGMFGLGLGIRVRDLWPVPARVFVLACGSTTIAAGTSLALVVLL